MPAGTAAIPARHAAVVGALLALATFAPYWQVIRNDFVNYDDPVYVTENPNVQRGLVGDTVRWAFTTTEESNWFPLTRLSHALDYELFGLNAGAHHLVSVTIHVLNVLVLFAVLARTTGTLGPSALVAALFSLHPLHVESVAWAAERKDVLSTLFALTAVFAYVVPSPKVWRYLLVCLLFTLGLMAKPMVVTLPGVLLLLDYWPLRRTQSLGRLVLEKVPLLVLAGASSLVTFLVQSAGGSVVSFASRPLGARLANATVSYVTYIRQMLWPTDLACFYPRVPDLGAGQVATVALLLVATTVTVLVLARRYRYLAVGWLWYVGMLVPVIGLVQFGDQARADRFTYLPLVGLFILIVFGARDLLGSRSRRFAELLGLAAVAACMVVTWRQVSVWRNSETLFTHALAVTSRNHVAHLNLGGALREAGRLEEARGHFFAVLALLPGDVDALNALGVILQLEGRIDEAADHYRAALSAAPDHPDAHYNLANALAADGQLKDAADEYARAIALNPAFAEAHNNLGSLLAKRGDLEGAIAAYERALAIRRAYPSALINLATAHKRRGDVERAIALYEEALRLKPTAVEAHNNLGNALAARGRFDDAFGHFAEALRIKPDYAQAHYNWGNALAQQGRFAEAAEHFAAALRLEPGNTDARDSLARARAATAAPPSTPRLDGPM